MVSWLVIFACYLPSTPTIFRGSPLKFKSDHVTFLPNNLQWFLILLECNHTQNGLNDCFTFWPHLPHTLIQHWDCFLLPHLHPELGPGMPSLGELNGKFPHLFHILFQCDFSMTTCSDHPVCFICQLSLTLYIYCFLIYSIFFIALVSF